MSNKVIRSAFYIVILYTIFAVGYTFHSTVIRKDFEIIEVEE